LASTLWIAPLVVTQSDADLLIEAGKAHWLTLREDIVEEKCIRHFLSRNTSRPASTTKHALRLLTLLDDEQQVGNKELSVDKEHEASRSPVNKLDRLIDWNVDVLIQGLRKVVAGTNASSSAVEFSCDTPGDGH
jgi:hypothetical protein